MPIVSGNVVAKTLRSMGYNKLIIGITGITDNFEMQELINSGVDYVFIKPLDIKKINIIIDFINNNGVIQQNKIMRLVDGVLRWS